MAAKPIFVAKVPLNYSQEQLGSIRSFFKVSEVNDDYHVLIVSGQSVDHITFECYNVTDIGKVSFEEFKETMNKAINKIKDNGEQN